MNKEQQIKEAARELVQACNKTACTFKDVQKFSIWRKTCHCWMWCSRHKPLSNNAENEKIKNSCKWFEKWKNFWKNEPRNTNSWVNSIFMYIREIFCTYVWN